MENYSSLSPEVFDLSVADRHDIQNFNETVLDFAKAGGAFVYAITPESGAFVVSPRALNYQEQRETYKNHQIQEVRDLIEDGFRPEDVLAGFQLANGQTFHYSLTPEEIWDIGRNLGICSPNEDGGNQNQERIAAQPA